MSKNCRVGDTEDEEEAEIGDNLERRELEMNEECGRERYDATESNYSKIIKKEVFFYQVYSVS